MATSVDFMSSRDINHVTQEGSAWLSDWTRIHWRRDFFKERLFVKLEAYGMQDLKAPDIRTKKTIKDEPHTIWTGAKRTKPNVDNYVTST